jgi:hypothetical protein
VRCLIVILVLLCLCVATGCKKGKTEEERAAELGRIMARAFVEELKEKGLMEEEAEEAGRAMARAFAEELGEKAKSGYREGELKSNMHKVQLALEDFSTMAEGAYPSGPHQMVRDVLVALGYAKIERADQTIDSLLPSNFKNPYNDELPGLSVSTKDPPDWSIELLGQVVWVPIGITAGEAARGYKIYGVGPLGLLDRVLESSR